MNHTERILDFFVAVTALDKQMNRLRSLYMEEVGLNGADLSPLLVLYTHPDGLRPDEFMKLTCTDKAQVSRSLAHLTKNGWVEKKGTTTYRAPYCLSVKGRQLMEKLAADCEDVFDQTHSIFNDETFDDFYTFCQAMTGLLEQMTTGKKQLIRKEKNTDDHR